MARNEIFISYSHKDKRWLNEFIVTLSPLIRKRKINVWDDTKITPGGKWKREIELALARARVAVLLVSKNFLHSEFIAEHELPPLLTSSENQGLIIVWIAVGYSLYEETEIAEYQAANDPARPLNALSESEADFELVHIAKVIDRLFDAEATDLEQSPTAAPASGDKASDDESTRRLRQMEAPIGALDRMRQTLAEGKWAWRTVDVLAKKSAIEYEEALNLLRSDPEIELSRSKSGKVIARLRTRIT